MERGKKAGIYLLFVHERNHPLLKMCSSRKRKWCLHVHLIGGASLHRVTQLLTHSQASALRPGNELAEADSKLGQYSASCCVALELPMYNSFLVDKITLYYSTLQGV